MLSLALILTICGGLRCKAQTFSEQPPRSPRSYPSLSKEGSFAAAQQELPPARVVEALPDGGYVVEIAGVKYRAVTDDQLREIQARKLELTNCSQERSLLEDEIGKLKTALALAQKDAQLADAQAAVERERAGRFQALFEGEQALRLQAEQLVHRGRVSRFFDNPWVQVAIKVGLPAVAAAVRR
jgi:hypothetical protein